MSDSDSDSEDEGDYGLTDLFNDSSDEDDGTFNPIKSIKKAAKKGLSAFHTGLKNIQKNPYDQSVQDEEMEKYTSMHPDLRALRAQATGGESRLKDKIYQSLYKPVEYVDKEGHSARCSLYDFIMHHVDPGSTTFEIVTDFLKVDFEKNIYALVVWMAEEGTYLIILIGGYSAESVIKIKDTYETIYDIYPFPYEMGSNSQLVVIPTAPLYYLDLKHSRGILKEIEPELGILTENNANKLAKKAIENILEKIAIEQLGERGIRPPDQYGLCVVKSPIEEKIAVKLTSLQSPLSALNIGELLAKFFISSDYNNTLYQSNIAPPPSLPPSKTTIANKLEGPKKNAQLLDSIRWQIPAAQQVNKAESKKRVQSEESKVRASYFNNLNAANKEPKTSELGGSKTKTKHRNRNKKSKRHMKNKNHRKTKKHRSKKSRKCKR